MLEYNAYCDESCHLPEDGANLMALGTVWCTKDQITEISKRIREIKEKHGLSSYTEIKWTKISPSKLSLYLDIVDYFFDHEELHFRGIIALDKQKLIHENGKSHDDWYYDMYFRLLFTILRPKNSYNIFLDKKDTHGGKKIAKLKEVLSGSNYDFEKNIIKSAHIISSEDSNCLQLCDILTGAIGYINRGLYHQRPDSAKSQIIDRIKSRSGKNLTQKTLPGDVKLNLSFFESEKMHVSV